MWRCLVLPLLCLLPFGCAHSALPPLAHAGATAWSKIAPPGVAGEAAAIAATAPDSHPRPEDSQPEDSQHSGRRELDSIEEGCEPPGSFVQITFNTAKVVHSNLGGIGGQCDAVY